MTVLTTYTLNRRAPKGSAFSGQVEGYQPSWMIEKARYDMRLRLKRCLADALSVDSGLIDVILLQDVPVLLQYNVIRSARPLLESKPGTRVPFTGAACGFGKEATDDAELVIARKDLPALLPASLLVFLLHDLGIILNDVCQALLREHLLPEVVGRDAVGIRRVAGAIIPPFVERQKPTRAVLQVGAHLHLHVIDREMHHATAEVEKQFFGVASQPVLVDRVIYGLLRELVLQLEPSTCRPRRRRRHKGGRLPTSTPSR